MKQEKLENRVKEIFEEQGFEVEQDGNEIVAVRDDTEKEILVFSSEKYTAEEVKEEVLSGYLVFIDEDLEEVHDKVENEVSVIRDDRNEKDYDLPSYELIGDIAVINDLAGRDEEGSIEGILENHPSVKTVLLKEEPLSGEFRLGGYRKLYGEETETIHKEFGCRYKADPTKAYFSERLGTERKRVIDQIEDGEKVLVIGAGVGPYPILAAKKADPGKVVAVEKNPEAFDYLVENIELNNVGDTVEAVEGDAREIELDGKFDRIIIAIPEFSKEFLAVADEHIEDGGIIHYYCFIEERNWESILKEIDSVAESYEILEKVFCGQRGPSVERVCIELKL